MPTDELESYCEQKENSTMANYVHSSASQDMIYPVYASGRQNQATVLKEIRINGTANVINPHTLMTPTGAVTEISDEDLALLKKSAAFQRHVAHGFMKVMESPILDTKDLQKRDRSAQILDSEFADGKDERFPQSGGSQASCGERDRFVGKPGRDFIPE